MLNYLLHVSLLLGLGFILYQVLLKKETFYALNRAILALYLVMAFLLPTIHIPQSWSLKSPISLEQIAIADISKEAVIQKENTTPPSTIVSDNNAIDMSTAKDQMTQGADVESSTQTTATDQTTAIPSARKEEITNTPQTPPTEWNIDWMNTAKWIYLVGFGIFFINFLVQLTILIYYRIKYPTLKDGKMTIVEMPDGKAPFSFLNMIYINPTMYDYDTYEQILAHEKIHITRWHSADIFLSELALILQWFNPFAWYYRKAVEHNLEYLTDQEMLASGANAEVYQMNLLKVSVPDLPLALSTNYNQSFLKKRIQMMNSKKSSARSTWKYLFILPILGFTMALLNPTLSEAQEVPTTSLETPVAPEKTEVPASPASEPTPASTPSQVIVPQNTQISIQTATPEVIVQPELNIELSDKYDISFLEIPEGQKSTVMNLTESAMKVQQDDGSITTINFDGDRKIIRRSDEDILTEGIWEAEIKGNKVCFYIKKGGIGKNYYWSSTECIERTDFNPAISSGAEGQFVLTREAGTLTIKGEFDDNDGVGRYSFVPDLTFQGNLASQGFNVKESKIIHLFLADVDQKYINFLSKSGYKGLDEDDLIAMAIHGVDEEYIKDVNGEFRKVNYDAPTAEELIAMKIHDVDMEYMKQLGRDLKVDLSVDQMIAAAIHNVDPDYIKEFKAAGFEKLDFDDLISASIHNVDPTFIKQFESAGFKNLDFDDMISASIHNVDPGYIKAFQAAGMQNVDFDDLVSASIHNVDIDDIKKWNQAGFDDLDFDDLISASIHNVDIDYVAEARSYGFDLDFDQLVSASIHNVELDYIKAFKDAGVESLDFDDLISASIHNVDPDMVEEFYAAGITGLDFDDLVSASIHNVDIDMIKEFSQLGFDKLDFDDYVSAAIHNIRPSYVKELLDSGIKGIDFDDVISFGIHNIDIRDIKGLQDLGLDLDADDMISAGIHNVTPAFIKRMKDKGFEDLDFDEYVKLKIHGF